MLSTLPHQAAVGSAARGLWKGCGVPMCRRRCGGVEHRAVACGAPAGRQAGRGAAASDSHATTLLKGNNTAAHQCGISVNRKVRSALRRVCRRSPIHNICSILTSIQSLLTDPNCASPANPEAAHIYTHDRKQYNRCVAAAVQPVGQLAVGHFGRAPIRGWPLCCIYTRPQAVQQMRLRRSL